MHTLQKYIFLLASILIGSELSQLDVRRYIEQRMSALVYVNGSDNSRNSKD